MGGLDNPFYFAYEPMDNFLRDYLGTLSDITNGELSMF